MQTQKKSLALITLKRYNNEEKYNNSSGRGVIPHRRYSPRPVRCNVTYEVVRIYETEHQNG